MSDVSKWRINWTTLKYIFSIIYFIQNIFKYICTKPTMNIDNCTLDTPPGKLEHYNLQHYEIDNPDLYQRVKLNNLKVGTRYRYCFIKNTYPECVTILHNDNNTLVITNPYFVGKEWHIKKNEILNDDEDIFYEKNYYLTRKNYLNLKEGLILPDGKCIHHISHYLFDDENITKEIASFLGRFRGDIYEKN